MSETRVQSTCEQCGKTDDHPKVHIGTTATEPDVVYHHDCLPARLRAQVVADPKAADIVAACEGGKRGQDLLDHIIAIHQEA
jgi:hypothetical protein